MVRLNPKAVLVAQWGAKMLIEAFKQVKYKEILDVVYSI
jgi:hypothetical protein